MVAPCNATNENRACILTWLLFARVHVSNYAVQQVHRAAKETHGCLQHSENRKKQRNTLPGFLLGFPLSELLIAAMHLCCVPDTPTTTNNQKPVLLLKENCLSRIYWSSAYTQTWLWKTTKECRHGLAKGKLVCCCRSKC